MNVAFVLFLQLTENRHLLSLYQVFNLNNEYTPPAYFAAMQIFVCAQVLFFIYLLEREISKFRARYWLGLVFIFLFLSMDEAFVIHEKTIEPLQKLLGVSVFLYHAWVIPYSVLALMIACLYIRFLLKLPHRTRGAILTAGSVYLSGCLGFEMVGAYYKDTFGFSGTVDLTYDLLFVTEEVLEMFGIALFLRTLLSYLSQEVFFSKH